jgi:hypothetical protein
MSTIAELLSVPCEGYFCDPAWPGMGQHLLSLLLPSVFWLFSLPIPLSHYFAGILETLCVKSPALLKLQNLSEEYWGPLSE